MSQYNVNGPDDGNDRTAAAGINLITVLIVLAVLVFLAWFLFTGPVQSMFHTGPTINVNPSSGQQQQPPTINVNPNVNVNPPSGQQPQAPQPQAPKAPAPNGGG